MALTRKMLRSMGLAEEQVEAIIDAHVEAVDALKGFEDMMSGSSIKSVIKFK